MRQIKITNFKYLFIVIISMIFLSCQKENEFSELYSGNVEFEISFKNNTLKNSFIGSTDNPFALVVTIQNSNNEAIYDNEVIELFNMNGRYISKPLSFSPGSYKLTRFFVINANNDVIYATPVKGSLYAYLVKEPLSIEFDILKDNTIKIVPEVLSTEGIHPQDFGYSTFSFDVVKTFSFLVSVFIYNESIDNFELTTAEICVLGNNDTLYTGNIEALTDTVTIKDGFDNYNIKIVKPGYSVYTSTFSADSLKLHYLDTDMGPLTIVLDSYFYYLEDFNDFDGWHPASNNGADCVWGVDDTVARIQSMGYNPIHWIGAIYEYDLPQEISLNMDFTLKAHIIVEDGDPNGRVSGVGVNIVGGNNDLLCRVNFNDSQARSGYGGIQISTGLGMVYTNDPGGFSTNNPQFNGILEIKKIGNTWKAYMDGILLGEKVFEVGRIGTKVQITNGRYRSYGYRDGVINYIEISEI